jgi:hypothetical protein
VEEARSRVTPALEAVAGTLTHLHLEKFDQELGWSGDEVKVSYELGAAVGKLWRLKDLALDLSQDGRVYHAVAQGLAANGGGGHLPLLWRVMISSEFDANADMLASLLLPSVRVFRLDFQDRPQALLIACALRQAGYKHTLRLASEKMLEGIVPAIASSCMFFSDSDPDHSPPYWEVWDEVGC